MTTTQTAPTAPTALSGERADLLAELAGARQFLRYTVQNLDDEQAAATPTASELCLGGLIKHVTGGEVSWTDFIRNGPAPQSADHTVEYEGHVNSFRMLEGETLEGLLAEYERVAAVTDELVRTVDLDSSQPLPEAPWFEPGARWSARRVILHIIAETVQHSGHADIIRETLDGQKTMG